VAECQEGHCGNSGTENSVKLIVALGTIVACEDARMRHERSSKVYIEKVGSRHFLLMGRAAFVSALEIVQARAGNLAFERGC
jgi:hypothetical protein